MKGLYKDRYLIAVYDRDEMLIDVGCSVRELRRYTNNSAHSSISHKRPNFVLIDVFEKHDDIFAEEDELFLKYLEECNITQTKKDQEAADAAGISLRTYYRHKQLAREKGLKGGD